MPSGVDAGWLFRRYELLKARRSPHEAQWRELNEFIRPTKRKIAQSAMTEGQRRTERLFDTTAPDANRKLAYFLNGSIVSASTRFFTMITRDPDLMRDREVAMWLEDNSTRMYMALQQSNFNAGNPQVFSSLSATGNAAVYEEERDVNVSGFNGLRFCVIPVGTYVMDHNADGDLDTFYREFTLSAVAAAGKFGLKALPQYLQDAYRSKPHERFEFLHAAVPRPTVEGGSKSGLPIASYYLDVKEKSVLLQSGYHEMPFFGPRWETEEGETYGRGPGHIALPDIRSLNRAKELGLQALPLMIRPPLQVPHDGVVGGQVRLTPAAQTAVYGDAEIKPIILGSDLKSEMIKTDELRQQIRSVFHRDLVALPDKNYMTATEIVKQLELIYREVGPALGQIQQEYLTPMLNRTFGLMWRAGAITQPPDVLAGADLDIEYEGPLARAQRTGDLTALQSALAVVEAMVQFDPSVVDRVDMDAVTKEVWESAGASMRLLRSDGAVKQIQESRAQAAQAQAQAEQAQRVADVAATGAQAGKTMSEAMQPQGVA